MTFEEISGMSNPNFRSMKPKFLFCLQIHKLHKESVSFAKKVKDQTFLFKVCILIIIRSIEAIVSSGEAKPSWAFCIASLKLAVIVLVSLSMIFWAVLKLRLMSSRGTLRRGASRMSWLSATSLVGFPIIVQQHYFRLSCFLFALTTQTHEGMENKLCGGPAKLPLKRLKRDQCWNGIRSQCWLFSVVRKYMLAK